MQTQTTKPKRKPWNKSPKAIFPLTLFGVIFLKEIKTITGCKSSGTVGVPYLTRINLIELPNGQKMTLHYFHRSDDVNIYHDHPFNFTTIPLLNGYIEESPAVYPDWQNDPAAASVFVDTARSAEPFQKDDPLTNAGFAGFWIPNTLYPVGTVAAHTEKDGTLTYWLKEQKVKGANPRTPPGPGNGWKQIAPDEPRRALLRPLTRNYRPAKFVHRVKLHTDRKGREKPALTLVFRSAKHRTWGFWQNLCFTISDTFFKENGC